MAPRTVASAPLTALASPLPAPLVVVEADEQPGDEYDGERDEVDQPEQEGPRRHHEHECQLHEREEDQDECWNQRVDRKSSASKDSRADSGIAELDDIVEMDGGNGAGRRGGGGRRRVGR